MNSEQWRQANALLKAVWPLPDDQRHAYLDKHCPPELRSLIDDMIEQQGNESETSFGNPIVTPSLPERIGRYTVLRHLGEGGMGTVSLARQSDPDREVALKVMKWGWSDQRMLDRFQREIQMLARLNHPGIAVLHESGHTDDQRPWYAMEFIDGMPLRTYVERHALSLPAIIALFEQVCLAVQHAHLHLILHRDLKPSNILVTDDGQGPRVKVIDFGIAAVLGEMGDGQTQIAIGTPAYMAPEVIGHPGQRDIRADVFSLGVILFQLVTGRHPFVRPGESPNSRDGWIATIRETDPLLASSITAFPRSSVKGDLDAILAMAIEKDPIKRYQSVGTLLDDLRAYQAGLPVQARQQSRWYLLGKFVVRHRAAVAAGLVSVIALVGALVISVNRTAAAERSARQAQAAQDFISEVMATTDPYSDGKHGLLMVEAMKNAADQVKTRFAEYPGTRLAVNETLTRTFLNLGEFEDAAISADAMIRDAREHDRSLLSWALTLRGRIWLDRGQYEDAMRVLQEAMNSATPGTKAWYMVRLEMAHVFRKTGRSKTAESMYIELLESGVFRDESDAFLAAKLGLGNAYRRQQKYELAISLYEELFQIQSQIEQIGATETRNNMALTYLEMGKYEQGERILREVLQQREEMLGPTHLRVLQTRVNMLWALIRLRRLDKAQIFGEETVMLCQAHLGNDHPETFKAQNNLARLYESQGEYAKALNLYEHTYSDNLGANGPWHPTTLLFAQNIGNIFRELQRHNEAKTLLNEVWNARITVHGPNDPWTLTTVLTLAEVLVETDRCDEAHPLLEHAYLGMLQHYPADHELVLIARAYLGYARLQNDQRDLTLLSSVEPHLARLEPGYRRKIRSFLQECP